MENQKLTAGIFTGATMTLNATIAFITGTKKGFENFLKEMFSSRYSDVPMVYPEQLDKAMKGAYPPLIFDVRTPQEYAVSCLRNAQYMNSETVREDDVEDIDRERTIVLYCSAGCLAAEACRKFRELGFRNVSVLFGGIILWYNQSRPVFSQGLPVQRIHPDNYFWGRFITRPGKTTNIVADEPSRLIYGM